MFDDERMEKINILLTACRTGNLPLVKAILKRHNFIHVTSDSPLRQACMHGRLEVVQYLLESPELSEHANLHALNHDAIKQSCYKGDTQLMAYLFSKVDSNTLPDWSKLIYSCFAYTCAGGKIEAVQYLLKNMQDQVSLEDNVAQGFKNACIHGHLQVVDFLLALKLPDKSYGFLKAFEAAHSDSRTFINHHLIHHAPIELLMSVEKFVKDKSELNAMLANRVLNEKLQQSLDATTKNHKKAKI